MSFISSLQVGLSAIESNPVLSEYAEPIILAMLTGSSTIKVGSGVISITQNGQASRFTLAQAAVAVETLLLTGEVSITIGTTVISYTPAVA